MSRPWHPYDPIEAMRRHARRAPMGDESRAAQQLELHFGGETARREVPAAAKGAPRAATCRASSPGAAQLRQLADLTETTAEQGRCFD